MADSGDLIRGVQILGAQTLLDQKSVPISQFRQDLGTATNELKQKISSDPDISNPAKKTLPDVMVVDAKTLIESFPFFKGHVEDTAFLLGNKVYVTKELIKAHPSAAEVVFIVGHEFGHYLNPTKGKPGECAADRFALNYVSPNTAIGILRNFNDSDTHPHGKDRAQAVWEAMGDMMGSNGIQNKYDDRCRVLPTTKPN